jgi:hypothetical protein
MKSWWDQEPWWLIILALPVLQIRNLILYVSTRDTSAKRIGLTITFLPIFALSSIMWAAAWGLIVTFILHILG